MSRCPRSTSTPRAGRLRPWVAALFLAFLWVAPAAQAEGTATVDTPADAGAVRGPPAAADDGALRVSVAPSIDDAALFPQWIAERNANAEQRLALPEHEQWVAIEISGATYDYRITVVGYRDGEVVGATSEPVVCECTSEALLGRLVVRHR